MSSPDRAGIIGTVVVHLVVITGAVWSARRIAEPTTPVYAVELIAASPPQQTTDDPSTEKVPPPVKATEEAPILKTTKKPPEKKPPVKVEKTPEKPPVTSATSTVAPLPSQTPRDGNNVANVSVPGFTTRYTGYTNNIVDQLMKQFGDQPRAGNPVVEIRFRILKDGSVTNIEMVRSSRSFQANLDARAALETVGRLKSFGPLPSDVNELDISFTFTPGRP